MIEYTSGDILKCEAEALVNTVNCVGVMGRGIAAQFKEQRRQWFRALLERLGAKDAEGLASQLQILVDGAIATALVRGDPAIARSARSAAETLLRAGGVRLVAT